MSIIEDEDKDNTNADSFRRNDIKVYKHKNQSKQVMELINNVYAIIYILVLEGSILIRMLFNNCKEEAETIH